MGEATDRPMAFVVAITGAAGYIGGRLLARLLAEPDVEDGAGERRRDFRLLGGGRAAVAVSIVVRPDTVPEPFQHRLRFFRHPPDHLRHGADILH